MENFREELCKAVDLCRIALTDEQIDKYEQYYELLIEGNKMMNLTSITEPKEAAIKHFADSLLAYDKEVFGKGKKVIDIGSGAGFPGLVLKIYNEETELTLLDSVGKKIKFLENVVDKLKLSDIKCVKARAEEMAWDKNEREKYDVGISRAVAPLNVLAEFVMPFLKVGGKMIALKGKKGLLELEESKHAFSVLGAGTATYKKISLPELKDERVIITVTKEKTTPNGYPRRTGLPLKKPL